MGCEISGEQLWSWIDRDAPELEAHLALCAFCRARAAKMREEIKLLAAETPDDIPLPEKVGSYAVKRLLGEGGQALVYEAEQASPRRLVALKVLKGGRLVDKGRLRHFRRETQTLARLNHPGIATIYEAGRTEDGLHYFAMELVHGKPLHAFVADEKPKRKHLLALFGKVCEAIHYAHERGVVHRDLKPSNIMIDPQGRPKILDFGLARLTHSDTIASVTVTKDGRVEGTPRYMSPEQALGKASEIDARTDVYALGVVLYEMLTGKAPSDVTGITPDALRIICEEIPRRPSGIDPSLRGKLDAILLKALEKDPGRRYQTVSELAGDISRYLDGRPVTAKGPNFLYVLGKRLSKRRSWAVLGAVAALALVIGIWWTRQSAYDPAWWQLNLIEIRCALLRDGPTDVAYYQATEAPRRFPRLPEATLVQAQAHCLRGEWSSAADVLTRGLVKDPGRWPYRALLDEIRLRRKAGAAVGAESPYWTPELSSSADAWYLRSFATLDTSLALTWAREGIRRDPGHQLALTTVVYLSEIIGDTEGAMAAARQLVDRGHGAQTWLQYRITELATAGRYEEALKECEELVSIDPDHGRAYYLRAKVERHLKQYAEADRDFSRAIAHMGDEFPGTAWLLFHRGTVRWMVGDREGAIADYREAFGFLTTPTFANARLFILLHEAGRPNEAADALADARKNRDAGPWLEAIFQCLEGKLAPERLANYARADGDPARLCEGYYYAGEAALLRGMAADAAGWFRKCVDSGARVDPNSPLDPMSEFELAQWRLSRLGGLESADLEAETGN